MKQSNNETMFYINDGINVLNEINSVGSVVKSIIKGLGQIAEINASGTIKYVHQDVLGSTILITDQNGQIEQQYEYDPFGQMIGGVMNTDDSKNSKYLYTGQELDQESELYYYNARYYNPVTGRFISLDPILGRAGDTLSRNGYIYAKNNPLKYVDPSGEEAKDVTKIFLDTIEKVGVDYSSLTSQTDVSSYLIKNFSGLINFFWMPLENLKSSDMENVPQSFFDELANKINIAEKYKQDFVGGKYDIKRNYPNKQWGFLTEQEMEKISKDTGKTKEFLFSTEPYGINGLGDVLIAGKLLRNDLPGNILYGYAGAASGLSKEFVQMLAGLGNKQEWLERKYDENKQLKKSIPWYKRYKGPSNNEIYNSYPFGWNTYFDDPEDQKAILMGYDLWKNNPCQSISYDMLLDVVNR
jgi:RHS repeat-associated protein